MTNLDGDGYPELIMSGFAGSELYSFNLFYEVTEDGSLETMDVSELRHCSSEPDLFFTDKL